MSATLNGWTAARLDDLAHDVDEIKHTLAAMQSEEVETLRNRVRDLEGRPRTILLAIASPILAAFLALLIEHIH